MATRMKTIKKQKANIGAIAGKGTILFRNVQQESAQVEIKKGNPFYDYMKNSSCFLFHRKSKIRKAIFKVVIDPDFDYP